MNTTQKAIPLFVLAAIVAFPAAAQGGTTFDCSASTTFSAGKDLTIPNSAVSHPCVAWRVTFSSTGSLNSTLTFQTSPDNVTFTNVTNQQCSGAVTLDCWTDGANPLTGTSNGTAAFRTYAAFVRVHIVVNSGSGTGTTIIYGYKGTSASVNTGGGAGGSVSITASGPIIVTPSPITGAGVVSCPGCNPGGSTGQLQYNTGSGFGGVGSPDQPNLGTTGATVTSLPTSGWSIINGALFNDFSIGRTSLHIPGNGTPNLRGITRTVTVPYTVYALIECGQLRTLNGLCGIYISDGTKFEGITQLQDATTFNQVRTETWTNTTSFGSVINGPVPNIVGFTVAFRVTNNSTTREFSYWSNGAWTSFLSEAAGTFLTETSIGPMGETGGAAAPGEITLLYWSQ